MNIKTLGLIVTTVITIGTVFTIEHYNLINNGMTEWVRLIPLSFLIASLYLFTDLFLTEKPRILE